MSTENQKKYLEFQFSEYPQMQIEDLYKLVYQGVMGSGHAITSYSDADNWLRSELLSIGEIRTAENTVEIISTEIARVNLRPFVASGGDTGALLDAFIRTGNEHKGSVELLLLEFRRTAGIQNQFSPAEIAAFIADQRERDFGSVHHSVIYRKLYRPAYRVVSRKELICLEISLPN